MTGEDLEQFVATLERSLLPPTFTVETRQRQFDEEGAQLAEFDIVISGRLGSASVLWLIECRDRPSGTSEPGAWIEQLDGRRRRFNFDKVAAVSTTGFSSSAVDYARNVGIDLRTVRWLKAEDFVDWFGAETFQFIDRSIHLEYAKVHVADTESNERREAAFQLVQGVALDKPILFNSKTRQLVTLLDAFVVAVSRRPDLWPEELRAGWSREVEIDAIYPADDCYALTPAAGHVPVPRILFRGTLSLRMTTAPFTQFAEYRDEVTDQRVASSVSADFTADEQAYRITLERVLIDGVEDLRFRIARAK